MVDSLGRPLTQSLFLEIGYQDAAMYTLKDVDWLYEGKWYPSIKKIYLDLSDPTEYEVATKFFLGWSHWQRLTENKVLMKHIQEWRDELEVKLRSEAVRQTIIQAKQGSYQAAKWVADRGWATRAAGRPSKAEIEKQVKMDARIDSEYGADILRFQQK